MFAVDLKLQFGDGCEDVAAVVAEHIFDGGYKILPIVVVVVLELGDFLVPFFSGDGRDNRIELLKLCLRVVVECPDSIFILLIELFLVEDEFVVGLVEGEGAVILLNMVELLVVVVEVLLVGGGRGGGRGGGYGGGEVDEEEGESEED